MKALKGTKTHDNLKAAFAGESQANRRYLYFARRADIEGYPEVGGLFRDTSEAETGHAFGHLPVVQGLLWRRAGLSEEGVQAASAHTFCVGLLGAALRLGAIGHIHSQETILALRPAIAALIAQPVAPVEEMYSCTPAAEIAAMRHEVQTARLFAN